MNKINWITFMMAVLSCHSVFSQNTFSPYTRFGLGDLQNKSMSHNFGMGEIGIGLPSVWNINNVNPALLTTNTFSVFELGVQGERRTLSNTLESQDIGTAGYKYLSFAFPVIAGRWTTNVSFSPYSSLNYKFSSVQSIENTSVQSRTTYEGNGGLTEVKFSNGIRLARGLSFGVRSSFIFGFTENQTTSVLVDSLSIGITSQLPSILLEKTDYRGYNFGFGIAYGRKIDENGNSLGIGFTYDLSQDLDGSRVARIEAQTNSGAIIIGDTLTNRTLDGEFQLPAKFGVGISWIKDNFISVGLDVTRSNWANNSGFGNDGETYRNTYTVGLGIEITPNYDDIDNYLARVRYRFGISYEQLPYVLAGTEINDFGINFGWSLPVRTVSSLNMAFKIGQRGTTDNALIKENYIKFVIGATINDRWFVRRKYN